MPSRGLPEAPRLTGLGALLSGGLSGVLGKSVVKGLIPGAGPLLTLAGALGIKIPVLDDLLDSLLGGLFKTKSPDLPDGASWGAVVRYTVEDGPVYEGQAVWSDEYDFPVARWSYSRQKMMPIAGLTREGWCLFVEKKGDTHSATGKVTGEYDGKDADELVPQADSLKERAAELGIPGGISNSRVPLMLLAIAAVALAFFMGRRR